jgi:hypothetical protein
VASRYLHVETLTAARPKHAGSVSGDTWTCFREAAGTTVILCDGLGHGIRAHVAATLCQARLAGLLKAGYSLRRAVTSVADSMEAARGQDSSYTAFGVLRILNDGDATVLSFDMPGAALLSPRHAAVLPGRALACGRATVMESNCHLVTGEGILLVSDGITQAGLGRGLREGWTLEGVARAADHVLASGGDVAALPEALLDQAERYCRGEAGDDITAIVATCRMGRTLNLFTGPPADREHDGEVVDRFVGEHGWKVVCGGTTASIVAARLEQPIRVEQETGDFLVPPRQYIEGIDLVTEGAVTLNQVYNLLDADLDQIEEESAVSELLKLIKAADRVNLFVGASANPASAHISFKQQGILSRSVVVPLIVAGLQAAGKLVVVETV